MEAVKPLFIFDDWYVVPLSKLYVTPLDGASTVIVPVETLHVGCVTVVVGAVGLGVIVISTESAGL